MVSACSVSSEMTEWQYISIHLLINSGLKAASAEIGQGLYRRTWMTGGRVAPLKDQRSVWNLWSSSPDQDRP